MSTNARGHGQGKAAHFPRLVRIQGQRRILTLRLGSSQSRPVYSKGHKNVMIDPSKFEGTFPKPNVP